MNSADVIKGMQCRGVGPLPDIVILGNREWSFRLFF
jgi:hypothetical protein